jgi:hypothetical protein
MFHPCTCASSFCSNGDSLSFFQMRLNGSRTFMSGSNAMPLGHCQRVIH